MSDAVKSEFQQFAWNIVSSIAKSSSVKSPPRRLVSRRATGKSATSKSK